jgi:hypothetical protein
METKLLGSLGRIAGVAGIALGIFFLLFQGSLQPILRSIGDIGPDASYAVVRSFMILTFGMAGIGVVAWLMSQGQGRGPLPTSSIMAISVLVAMVLIAAVYVGSLQPATRVEVAAKEPPTKTEPQPKRTASYTVCVGELANRCPAGSVVLGCGSSVETWAQAQCKSINVTKLSDTSGNRCGYYVANVSCELR